MMAGTLGLLEETVADPVASHGTGGFDTLDVRETQAYLDGARVQSGAACALVEATTEKIHVDGTDIDIERVESTERVHAEWIADVTDAGFVLAERTAGTDPMFPFDVFRGVLGTPVEPAVLDPSAFVTRQDDIDLWFSGSKAETASETKPNDVSMGYGRESRQAGGNVGVGFKMGWNGTTVRGVLYQSGYVSVYNETWGPIQFARFVRDAVLPVAAVPESDDESEQGTLGETGGGDEFADEVAEHLDDEGYDVQRDGADADWTEGECDECGHERTKTREKSGRRVCIICDEDDDGEGVSA